MQWLVMMIVVSAFFAVAFVSDLRAQSNFKTEVVPQIPHTSWVSSVAFSPDGKYVASGSWNESLNVKLWDASTGKLLRTFSGHPKSVEAVAISPDGRQVLSGSSDKTLKLWDTSTGRLIRTFEGHEWGVSSVAFSHDGRRVVSSSMIERTLKVWDASSGQIILTLAEQSPQALFSPDDKKILSCGAGTVKLWDASTGQLLHAFTKLTNEIHSIAFSPDGTHIISGADAALKLWDVSTGKLASEFSNGTTDNITTVAFSPDGRHILSGSAQSTLKLWDVSTGKRVHIFEGHTDEVTSIAFSPDGKHVVSAGKDNSVRSWDVSTGLSVNVFGGDSRPVRAVAFSPDGRSAISGGDDAILRLWDVSTARIVRTFVGHTEPIYSVAFSPDGKQALSGSWDYKLKLWDVETSQIVRTIEHNTGPVDAAVFSPDGTQILTGGYGDALKLWNAMSGEMVRSFEGVRGAVATVAFSPDGEQVLSGAGNQTPWLWDVATGQVLRKFEGSLGAVNSVAFSPDGSQVLLGSGDHNMWLWDAATVKAKRTFSGHADWVTSVAFSPDGKQIVSGSWDQTLKLWNTESGKVIHTFKGHASNVNAVAYSPDRSNVLSGSNDGTVRIWAPNTGEPRVSLFAAKSDEALSLTPEGFFLTSSPRFSPPISIVRGLEVYGIEQMWQSLYSPDLVREKLAGDPDGEVAKAAAVINLDKVLDSGKAPKIIITSPVGKPDASNEIVDGMIDEMATMEEEDSARLRDSSLQSTDEIITAEATITEQEGGGIGRIEWRVNGVTVGVSNPAPGTGGTLTVKQTLALDPGENSIEVVAYNGRHLLATVPAQTKVIWADAADIVKPTLHALAIGINNYVDKGGVAPGETTTKHFRPLGLAVGDATALAAEIKKAGEGLYGQVRVRTVLDGEATAANLDAIVTQMGAEIQPRDTFVLFAAAHGYSNKGRYYLIPQDYQGGPDPNALAARAIDQNKLQDWIANRIRAKKALILLDTCESGALTSSHTRSRFEGPASDAAIGRLHEATGRPVLTAAGLGQSALELTELGHGVFTSALIDAFYRGDASGDGAVSISELVAHVQYLVPKLIKDPKVRDEVIRRGSIGGVQSARFGSRGEDFVFVRRLQ